MQNEMGNEGAVYFGMEKAEISVAESVSRMVTVVGNIVIPRSETEQLTEEGDRLTMRRGRKLPGSFGCITETRVLGKSSL